MNNRDLATLLLNAIPIEQYFYNRSRTNCVDPLEKILNEHRASGKFKPGDTAYYCYGKDPKVNEIILVTLSITKTSVTFYDQNNNAHDPRFLHHTKTEAIQHLLDETKQKHDEEIQQVEKLLSENEGE